MTRILGIILALFMLSGGLGAGCLVSARDRHGRASVAVVTPAVHVERRCRRGHSWDGHHCVRRHHHRHHYYHPRHR